LKRIILVSGLGLSIALSAGCGVQICKNHIGEAVKSPDGSLQAAVLTPACGADVRDLHWVLLESATRKVRRESKRVAVFEGPVHSLTWEGGVLVIHHGKSAPVSEMSLQSGTRIIYRAD
jgi:hypothetical protein